MMESVCKLYLKYKDTFKGLSQEKVKCLLRFGEEIRLDFRFANYDLRLVLLNNTNRMS
jgi:hypothetical protein